MANAVCVGGELLELARNKGVLRGMYSCNASKDSRSPSEERRSVAI